MSIKKHPLGTEAEERPRPTDLEDVSFWAWMDRFCQVLPFVVVVLACRSCAGFLGARRGVLVDALHRYTLNAYAYYLGFGPRRG